MGFQEREMVIPVMVTLSAVGDFGAGRKQYRSTHKCMHSKKQMNIPTTIHIMCVPISEIVLKVEPPVLLSVQLYVPA